MVKLFGLLKSIPNTVFIFIVAFLIGFTTGYSDKEGDYKDEQIEELQAIIKGRDETIMGLIQEQSRSNVEQSTLDKRIDRLQHNLNEANRKLAETTGDSECRSLLSEGAGLHREGYSLLRKADILINR